ncbi:hypothetical protein Tco_1203828 [Tanacetum coccineum]
MMAAIQSTNAQTWMLRVAEAVEKSLVECNYKKDSTESLKVDNMKTNFTASKLEMLDQPFDRLQKLVSPVGLFRLQKFHKKMLTKVI